jgi:hypothetical protein
MPLPSLINPLTIVLRTDVYRLDISDPGASEAILGVGFTWMQMSGVEWLTENNPMYYVAQYYSHWVYAVSVDIIRTLSVDSNGLSVVDSQIVTSIKMTISGLIGGPWWYWSSNPSVILNYDPGLEYGFAPFTPFPSSMTFTYNDATFNAATGLSTGIPQGLPFLENAGAYTVNSQSPIVSIDPDNTFTAYIGGVAQTIHKLIGNKLLPTINEGGTFDPQTSGNVVSNAEDGTIHVGYGAGGIQWFGGVDGTTFGLLLNQPSVPLGALVCKSTPQGVFPALPELSAPYGAVGAVYSSVAANVSSWGGFRYLSLNARVTGFATGQPLPRILIGIVPQPALNQATCAAALAGSPTTGTWYECEVTEQGTEGQNLTIDLAKPLQGSGKWLDSYGGTYNLPDPLGVGMFATNMAVPLPGGRIPAGLPDAGETMAPAVLVVTVDGSECQIVGSAASIILSNFKFVEETGSVLSVNCFLEENQPVAATNQPTGIEASSPLDGTLITLRRDGKAAVQVRTVHPADAYGTNPFPGLTLTLPPYGGLHWSNLLSELNAFGNGYSWTFEPLYSNFMTGGEYPPAFFPVPTQFPDASFKLGASVSIPIAARISGQAGFATYSNSCPWADVGAISGDSPLVEDKSKLGLLALSDYTDGWQGGDLTVQSAKLVSGAPTVTTDYGPTALTTDADGAVYTVLNSSETQSEWNGPVSPEIDGVLVTFDEGLALGQSDPSGRTRTVYVPIRAGEIGYGGAYPPSVKRGANAAFCLRADIGGPAKYSEPRNAFWRLTSERARLVATLLNGYSPYATSNVQYPQRDGAAVFGLSPQVDIYESAIRTIYKNQAGDFVTAVSLDQLTTLGSETLLFNQSGGNVTFEYDQSTGGQLYCMSLRSDGLSWLTPPASSSDPSRLPQVAVLRRRDAQGSSLPFVTASGAALSGTIWENVIYLDAISNGTIGIQVLPQGTVVLTCGTAIYTSTDNGSNFYDQTGTLVQSLTNQTSGQLQSGATGGTQNP